MNLRLKMSVVAVACVLSGMAQAAETASLDEVVVTAPQSTEALTVKTNPKKPRQPVPAHDGADYLKTIPGFSVIRKGGTDGDPVFRGMAGSRLNILLDGEQILGGCGGRMDPPTAYVFPASYDRITVLKGPQTVLYGSGNSAGTVLFERVLNRAGQSGNKGQAALMLGSFGRNDEMLDAKTGSANYYLRAGATRSQANDYKDGNGVAVHSAYTRWSGNAAFGWTPDDNTRLELTVAKSDGKAAYADRSVDGSKFARDNVGLKFDKQHMGGVLDGIEAQVYYNYVDHVMDTFSLRAGGNPASMMAAMNPDRKTTGGRMVGTLNLAETSQLKLGVDTQSNVHTGRVGAAPGYMGDYTLQPRVKDAEFKNVGVFGELKQGLSNTSRAIFGLRADSWQASDYRATVDMMGMVANPTQNQTRKETLPGGFARYELDASSASTMYVGVGRTTRTPDYWELFSFESATTASSFNTNPEKTTQLDAGLNFRDGVMSASISGFFNKISDFILVQSKYPKPSMMSPAATANIARNVNATTYGTEAGLGYQLAESWKLDGSLAYVRGSNDTEGTALGQITPLEARLGFNYDDKVWSFGGLLRGVAAQNRVAVNQGNIAGQDIAASSGFGVFSLNGGWRANKSLQVTAGVDNLFNKAYAEHISRAGAMVSGFTQTTRVNELGRNAWLKANFDF